MGPDGTKELQFDKSFTVETHYPCSSLIIASSTQYVKNEDKAQIPLMTWKLDPPLWLHLLVKWDQNDLTRMHQPIREYRGITGGFILLANTITIKNKMRTITAQGFKWQLFTLNHRKLHLQSTMLATCVHLTHLNCSLFSHICWLQTFNTSTNYFIAQNNMFKRMFILIIIATSLSDIKIVLAI